MTEPGSKQPKEILWEDHRLVRACLNGNQEAWAALIEKYKNLIFSIPIKYGLSRDDAAEIFQQVCVELFAQLANLREPGALAKWLMQVTSRRCFHWKRQQGRFVSEDEAPAEPTAPHTPESWSEDLRDAEREQFLRNALREMSPRCRQLIHMLFFEQPVRPYDQVAASLGIATGSVGFIRGRCLQKMRRQLGQMGFE